MISYLNVAAFARKPSRFDETVPVFAASLAGVVAEAIGTFGLATIGTSTQSFSRLSTSPLTVMLRDRAMLVCGIAGGKR